MSTRTKTNYKICCPICSLSNKLEKFEWNQYDVIHCKNCDLDYCSEMIEKEVGGDSSPVHMEGINMMADVFFKTGDLANNYAKKRKKIYEQILGKKCINILEIGCGPGVFYKSWETLKVNWTGIDINPYWKKFGEDNNIPIFNTSTESISKKFDVIMAHQVIEHVEDPLSFMKNIKLMLNPGGLIHLELPNQDSFTSKLRRISSTISYDYGFIQPPMHLRAYRQKTIKYLFNNLDLEPKMVFTCSNNDRIWGQVRDYNFNQKLIFTLAGKIGLGSLLIGLAQKINE